MAEALARSHAYAKAQAQAQDFARTQMVAAATHAGLLPALHPAIVSAIQNDFRPANVPIQAGPTVPDYTPPSSNPNDRFNPRPYPPLPMPLAPALSSPQATNGTIQNIINQRTGTPVSE
jgi:hypothetical protein